MKNLISPPDIPSCAWSRPIGLGWENPYTVRYASNLGEHVFRSLPACQFSVFEQVEGGSAQAYALCTEPPADGSLSRWSWYPAQKGTYSALYPRC